MDLAKLQKQIEETGQRLPPVDKWNPDFCGDIDMVIKHDGSWFYMGTPIGRHALVKLFASVLKREGDDYFLVTPVEKIGITVEDAPFLVTQWYEQDGGLVFTTNTEDSFVVSTEHPVELYADKCSGDVLPYVKVRRNLWARLHQNVFYQLADIGQAQSWQGQQHLMLQSGDYRFSLGSISD